MVLQLQATHKLAQFFPYFKIKFIKINLIEIIRKLPHKIILKNALFYFLLICLLASDFFTWLVFASSTSSHTLAAGQCHLAKELMSPFQGF